MSDTFGSRQYKTNETHPFLSKIKCWLKYGQFHQWQYSDYYKGLAFQRTCLACNRSEIRCGVNNWKEAKNG